MKAILLVFLFALVASSEIQPLNLPDPKKFMECVKDGLKKDDMVPAVLRAFEETLKTKSLAPLLKVGKQKLPELLALGKACLEESKTDEVELHNIFNDIGGMIKDVWNDLVSIGKTAWNSVLGEVKTLFDNHGETLIHDIWEGLKQTGKEIVSTLIDCAKDALKNLVLDALSDPAHAIEHLTNSLKGIPTKVRDTALGFRLPEGSLTAKTIEDVKEIIKGVREDVRKEVREAMDKGRDYALETCKKLIDTDKVDLCKYINAF